MRLVMLFLEAVRGRGGTGEGGGEGVAGAGGEGESGGGEPAARTTRSFRR